MVVITIFVKGKIFGINIGFSIMKERKEEVFGYTNRCDDGKFIVFLDYDDMPYEWVIKEIKSIQKDFNLGDFYMFKSSESSFHAVCFTKVQLGTLRTILMNSSCDENYHRVPYSIGKRLLTLRLTEKEGKKPKFNGMLLRDSPRLESYEHKKLIHKLFRCMTDDAIISNSDFEHPTKIIIANYKV